MEKDIAIKQGHSIYIYEEEVPFILDTLSNKNISLDCFDKKQNILTLNQSYVGYIKTNKRIIELQHKNDKITLNHIIRMYYFVHGNFKNFDDSIFDIDNSENYKNIIDLFIKELLVIRRKGLATEYVSKVCNSSYAIGNVNYTKSYKNLIVFKENPFECTIDELTLNTILNKVLKSAFKKVLKIKPNNPDINALRGLFSGIDDLGNSKFSEIVDFSSKNYYCKNAYFLAKLILDESYFNNKGNSDGECFLINSDLLFEKFIKKILFRINNDVKFIEWNNKKVYGEYRKGNKEYIPDILFNYSELNSKATAVLDVKNKFNEVFKNPDIFQMVFYSTMLNSNKAILCYPCSTSSKIDILEIFSDKFVTNKIYAVYINIASDSKEDFKKSIYKFINEIYECIESK
ncbi:hypothetical protein QYB54_002631 [Clostridium perfringens]|nr:hypothetical protein [Clostridium perfringens]